MGIYYQPRLGIGLIISVLCFYMSLSYGQVKAPVKFVDSSLHASVGNPIRLAFNRVNNYPVASYVTNEVNEPVVNIDDRVLDNLEEKIAKPKERKKLLGYLKLLKVESSSSFTTTRAKFYYRLANTFARLRLYPLAMKCFLKTIPKHQLQAVAPSTTDSLNNSDAQADSDIENNLDIDLKDDSLMASGILNNNQQRSAIKSKPITYQRIHQTFDDGKKAIAYAMLFHVKQPVRGKRKIFVLNNVGHTFITLIKYNADSTYTSVSFGFYPQKDNLLSATPLIPSTSSVFKDDSGHEWDEVLGKFISRRTFTKIQGLILQYNGIKYNLSKNNCTDFGIKAALLAGISIHDTYGTWPLGKGNNPAVTGQSILQHNFDDTNGTSGNIFVDWIDDAAH